MTLAPAFGQKEHSVKITLLSEESIRLEPTAGPMTIEAMSPEQSYSPFHMLAGGLAYCTFSVFYAWAEHAKLDASSLTIDVSWTFADDPHRVAGYDLRFNWPGLPANRLDAARRVAELCTVHATFTHPPAVSIDGAIGVSAASDARAQADGADAPIVPAPTASR
ncbi:MAG TPA: OsmC family protein [Polyangiales bacterium]